MSSLNPITRLYDDVVSILKNMVIKYSAKADEYETLEIRSYAEEYMAAYTKVDNLRKYRFDSIDSTTWTVGGRFGEASKFENGSIKRLSFRDKGVKYKMVRDKEALTLYNFKEWLKFQHYADKNL